MKLVNLLLVTVLMLICMITFGQDTATITPPSAEEIKAFLVGIGGLKGASALVIAVFIAQGFNLFIRSSLGGNLIKSGFWRMTSVAILTWVLGVLGLMIATHVNFLDAILNSANLALLQAFIAALWKQYQKIESDKKLATTKA